MSLLYGYKWTRANGEEFNENTQAGKVWIAKTYGLEDQQWVKALERCEKEVRIKTHAGDESWPPSYEEFVAYAKESNCRAHRRFARSLPEPDDVKQKRKLAAQKGMAKVKALFDDD